MKLVKVTDSFIKGYHAFKIRPHPDIEMSVKKDIENLHDPSAMLVAMPQLKDIPSGLHKIVTRPPKGIKEKEQTVEGIAGKDVGRIPANVCGFFKS